jgi:hypothetical protein
MSALSHLSRRTKPAVRQLVRDPVLYRARAARVLLDPAAPCGPQVVDQRDEQPEPEHDRDRKAGTEQRVNE